mgnify:FL=1
MISQEPDFCCVICERKVNTRWCSVGRDEEVPPVCRYCERQYAEGVGKPAAGSFRDRRNAMRIYALAEALHTAAMRIQWSTQYAAA